MRIYSIIIADLFLIVFASEIFSGKDKGSRKLALALTLIFAPVWWYIIKF